jgi:hypothetical protein
MRNLALLLLLAPAAFAQQPTGATTPEEPKLKLRTDLPAQAPAQPTQPGDALKALWIIPAGTRIPIQLRQPISTKNAQAGDPIYAQTTFPIVIDSNMVVPAGTWVQGKVDMVKRAGRIKGTAELQFHLTTLIYANGYTLDINAAIAQVPGAGNTNMKEPGTVKQDTEHGKDLERVGDAASKGGQIGAIAGAAARPSMRGFGIGGLSGIAAGTLIGLLARGSDVEFATGTAVEISLGQAMAVDPAKIKPVPGATPQ